MDEDELVEHVHDLQRSLQDGDDLARAIALIGDALDDIEATLGGPASDGDGDRG